MTIATTADIRADLARIYRNNPFVPMVEIKGASFWADKPAIIGRPNPEYIKHEIAWYLTQSRNISDMPGEVPLMWRRTADSDGWVNSNYGWVLWSQENGSQFDRVCAELRRDWASRRAVCIYTRPTMHVDQKLGGGGQDFMCTNAVHYSITRDGALDVVVQMRSNDVVFGYRNDYAWQVFAAEAIIDELNRDFPVPVRMGVMLWQAASLHVYPRHFHLLRAIDPENAGVTDGNV